MPGDYFATEITFVLKIFEHKSDSGGKIVTGKMHKNLYQFTMLSRLMFRGV